MYKLSVYKKIRQRIEEPRRFIQHIMGPRQVGKSTVVKQEFKDISILLIEVRVNLIFSLSSIFSKLNGRERKISKR